MKVFISWSGQRSRRIAEQLNYWLPYIIQPVRPFMSSGIRKGTRWGDALAQELEETKYGIVCVTQQNMLSPWLNFEAGALSKTLFNTTGHACAPPAAGHAFVSPVLFGVEPAKLVGPLSQFQTTEFADDGKEMLGLVCSINQTLPDELRVPRAILECTFQTWWKDHLCPAIKEAMQPQNNDAETETGLEWLRSVADFAELEGHGRWRSVMVINPDLLKDWDLLKDTMRANLSRGGIEYIFIVPSSQKNVVWELIQPEVRHLNCPAGDAGQAKVSVWSMNDEEEYKRLAATHYRLLQCGEIQDAKVFFEIPVEPCGYWAEARGESAVNFRLRFGKLKQDRNYEECCFTLQPEGQAAAAQGGGGALGLE